jgi:hypothetical protein
LAEVQEAATYQWSLLSKTSYQLQSNKGKTLYSSGQQLSAMFGQMGSQMEQALAPAAASIEHFD